ncbi:MAG: hypothetical protein B7Y56_14885 [Gallionellales bacterium 35-53-114]|jgi:transposase|nr:MAG: hypothetical protein B7Y56_14885 [Gallionellales bacterium 35-53-114]OYZ62117.1 MAG: hypothetical protein B7Y04_15340 [Gallionellales bacterium 24-53-125]OZB07322.1 MAG: hypothetical protein B7X61_15285 [Gallionellales bacterium 39-52-133]HQS59831.1 transposase [Gallionellaceae bacterium]HQS76585.1 transposase [Gallionellaceae bacterium]
MAKSGLLKVHRYSMHFKATAVRLSEIPDVLIQDVAEALDIHPFTLSRWRKQAREGLIVTKGVKLDDETVAELKRLRPVLIFRSSMGYFDFVAALYKGSET